MSDCYLGISILNTFQPTKVNLVPRLFPALKFAVRKKRNYFGDLNCTVTFGIKISRELSKAARFWSIILNFKVIDGKLNTEKSNSQL
jgi:hypothetical protein